MIKFVRFISRIHCAFVPSSLLLCFDLDDILPEVKYSKDKICILT